MMKVVSGGKRSMVHEAAVEPEVSGDVSDMLLYEINVDCMSIGGLVVVIRRSNNRASAKGI